MRKFFRFEELGTNYHREIIAGVTTFATIVLMSFTYNIGIGMTAGFVLYPLMKVITGRVREVPTGMWVLSALSLAFFAFYPY